MPAIRRIGLMIRIHGWLKALSEPRCRRIVGIGPNQLVNAYHAAVDALVPGRIAPAQVLGDISQSIGHDNPNTEPVIGPLESGHVLRGPAQGGVISQDGPGELIVPPVLRTIDDEHAGDRDGNSAQHRGPAAPEVRPGHAK